MIELIDILHTNWSKFFYVAEFIYY
jgi:hypothetical protein